MEGWKKIITVERCLKQFLPDIWQNLELHATKIECRVKKGIGISTESDWVSLKIKPPNK